MIPTGTSTSFFIWKNKPPNVCWLCKVYHDKMYEYATIPKLPGELHTNCKCYEGAVLTIQAGKATTKGIHGADWQIAYHGRLPQYYISKATAKRMGWYKYKGNLDVVAPGKMIGGSIYYNGNGRLPLAPGRIWYEADINYINGIRNNERLVFSTDGLIFVTYDHYITFYEVIKLI